MSAGPKWRVRDVFLRIATDAGVTVDELLEMSEPQVVARIQQRFPGRRWN